MVDVVVLNFNDADTTIGCINHLSKFGVVRKIVVVDNCSTDNSLEKLNRIADRKINVISSDHNGGYGAGNNLGIRYLYEHYDSDYILLSNPDVIVEEDVLSGLENFLVLHEDYMIVAPFMVNSKGQKQFNTAFRIPSKMEYIFSLGMLVSKFGKTFYYKNIVDCKEEYLQVGAVSGSMFLMDAKKMIDYGMYDENIFLYCEEISLGLRIKEARQKVALIPGEKFIHNHSVSISKTFKSEVAKKKLLVKSKLYVIRKYYKPNKTEYLLAQILGKISIAEVSVLSMFRR